MTRLVTVLLALLSFTGCTLIDQRTFAPSPEAKAQPAPPPAPVVIDTRTALVTIDYTQPSPDYAQLLHAAVRAAEFRYPDVQYDVISVLPGTADGAGGAGACHRRDAGDHAGSCAGQPHSSRVAHRPRPGRGSGACLRPLTATIPA